MIGVYAVLVVVIVAPILGVYLASRPKCKHVPGEWRMRDWGMGKIRSCVKCGKCVDLI